MKIALTILAIMLVTSPARGAYPKMESTSFVITSSELSGMGKYKVSASFDTWDTLGQPSTIGQWPKGTALGGSNSGAGWIYTINLPVWWDKDHDRDGMPLAFEEQFAEWNGHTMWDYNPYDASQDWDGDGFTNIQEYLSRSDPTDATSFFQFTDIRVVTSQGNPLMAWWSATTEITGFESDYPDYPRSLGFDLLYADWTTSSQAARQMPNEDWFNQTGTWQLVSGATGMKRDGDFNTYTETIAGGEMNDGDIRFYRLAIGGTWDQGEPTWGSFNYYTATGNRILASTVAQEVLMIQKHVISSGEERSQLGLAGVTTGGEGKLDFILGKNLFPAGSDAGDSTNFDLWVTASASVTVDYLLSGSNWRAEPGGGASTRKVIPDDGFRLIYQPSLSSPITFYAAAQLKMDSYYHDVYHRAWNGQTITAGDPSWGASTSTRATFISYNFPVEARFRADFSPAFPTLAGTTNPTFSGWEFLESDYVMFYNRDISSRGGVFSGYTNDDVGIYFDHGADNQWEYFLPFGLLGTDVGTELLVSPGSPVVIIQYWNPDDPTAWTSFTLGDPVPYQNSGGNDIKTYLKY